MILIEKRDVEVKVCDVCGEETSHLEKCTICGRDLCYKDGGIAHSAFSVEIYKYDGGNRLNGVNNKVCRDCAGKRFSGTIGEFLDGMMSKNPITVES